MYILCPHENSSSIPPKFRLETDSKVITETYAYN